MDVINAPPNRNPDLSRAASILGVHEESLRRALGAPHPNLAESAIILGIDEEMLRAALGLSR